MNNHQSGGTGLSDENGIWPLQPSSDTDQLAFGVGRYHSERIGRFNDGHKYESYCTCSRGLSGGITSQEDRVGEYSSFDDAVDGWNERAN